MNDIMPLNAMPYYNMQSYIIAKLISIMLNSSFSKMIPRSTINCCKQLLERTVGTNEINKLNEHVWQGTQKIKGWPIYGLSIWNMCVRKGERAGKKSEYL